MPNPEQRPLPVRRRGRPGPGCGAVPAPGNSIVDVIAIGGQGHADYRQARTTATSSCPSPYAGIDPSQALADNQRFKVVWQVLNALRSRRTFRRHDQQPGAQPGRHQNRARQQRLLGGHIGPSTDDPDTDSEVSTGASAADGVVLSRRGRKRSTPASSTRSAPASIGTNGPPTSPTSPDPRSPESTPSSATATPILRCASSLSGS